MKRIGYILGRRIRGDIELDNAIGLLRPAFILSSGRRLTGVEQWPTVRSATQRYSIGSRLQLDDRVLRYARINDATYGPTNAPTQVRIAYGVSSVVFAASDENNVIGAVGGGIGDTTLQYVTTAAIPAGRYDGGYISIGGGAGYGASVRILTQPIAAAGGTTITLQLVDPLPIIIAAGSAAALYASPYASIESPRQGAIEGIGAVNSGRQTFLGVPLVNGLKGEWVWVLTSGPAFVVSGSGVEGTNMDERQLVWDRDGSVELAQIDYPAPQSRQMAGYILPATNSALALPAVGVPGGPDGMMYMMLQGAP
ncbi:hypothetical protein ES703_103774 [subsurface metagenome]